MKKVKSSPYSVDNGRIRIARRINERTTEVPEGVESIMRSKSNGLQHYVPLKNKEGKPLSNAQYVRLIAELGDDVEQVDKDLVKYAKQLVQSGKSDFEINKEFGTFMKNIFVKTV